MKSTRHKHNKHNGFQHMNYIQNRISMYFPKHTSLGGISFWECSERVAVQSLSKINYLWFSLLEQGGTGKCKKKWPAPLLKVLKEQNDAKGSNAIRPAGDTGNGDENRHNLAQLRTQFWVRDPDFAHSKSLTIPDGSVAISSDLSRMPAKLESNMKAKRRKNPLQSMRWALSLNGSPLWVSRIIFPCKQNDLGNPREMRRHKLGTLQDVEYWIVLICDHDLLCVHPNTLLQVVVIRLGQLHGTSSYN